MALKKFLLRCSYTKIAIEEENTYWDKEKKGSL